MHLTTSRSGGAGVAATRLAGAQQNDPRTQVQIQTLKNEDDLEFEFLSQKISAIQSKVLTGYQQAMAKKEFKFVSPLSVSRVNWENIQDYDPDVIQIHNWYNYLDMRDIERLLTHYKVVFSAHDERLLTGGCHITFGCNQYLKGCESCPQVRFGSRVISSSSRRLHQILSESENYSIIAPSNWLSQKFQSATFVNPVSKVNSIPNVVPVEFSNHSFQNQAFNYKFLFVSSPSNMSNKGIFEVLEAMDRLSENHPHVRFQLQIAGLKNLDSRISRSNLEITCLGKLNQVKMQKIYQVSDALIVASKSENSPNVISEAQIQGTIVIANDVGGIPEIVENRLSGLLYKSTADNLSLSLSEFINLTDEERAGIRITARSRALSRHNVSQILDNTYSVYLELLERESK
jgi:glycosyltransferase involved in cell wall biosynthesis